jgi:hypothetical protein
MKTFLKPLTAAAVLLPTLAFGQVSNQPAAENFRIRLEYRWFETELQGDAAKGFAGIPGTPFDVKDDLLMGDDRTYEIRGAIRVGAKWKLRGSYTSLDYKGDVVLVNRIRFDDTTFNAGEQVASSLKGAYYGGDLEYDLILHKSGYLGVTGGARAPDVDFVLSAPASGKRELGTERPVCPVVGLVGRIYAGRLSLEASGSTFAKISGRKTIEFEGSARIHLSDRFAISGGYRYISFKAESDGDLGDLADFQIKGWTYGLEVGL